MQQYYINKFLSENASQLLNKKAAMKFIGISSYKFNKEVSSGKICFYEKSGKIRLYHVNDLSQWLTNSKEQTSKPIIDHRKNDVVEYGITPTGMHYVSRIGHRTYYGALHKSIGFPNISNK